MPPEHLARYRSRRAHHRRYELSMVLAFLLGISILGVSALGQRVGGWEIPGSAVPALAWFPRVVFALAAGAAALAFLSRRSITWRAEGDGLAALLIPLAATLLLTLMLAAGPLFSALEPEQWPLQKPGLSFWTPLAAVLLVLPGLVNLQVARSAVAHRRRRQVSLGLGTLGAESVRAGHLDASGDLPPIAQGWARAAVAGDAGSWRGAVRDADRLAPSPLPAGRVAFRLSGDAAAELAPAAERARAPLLHPPAGDEPAAFIQRAAALYGLIHALESSGGAVAGFLDARGRFHAVRLQAPPVSPPPGAATGAAVAAASATPEIAFELTSGATALATPVAPTTTAGTGTPGPGPRAEPEDVPGSVWRALALYSLYVEQVAAGRTLAVLDAGGEAREVVP